MLKYCIFSILWCPQIPLPNLTFSRLWCGLVIVVDLLHLIWVGIGSGGPSTRWPHMLWDGMNSAHPLADTQPRVPLSSRPVPGPVGGFEMATIIHQQVLDKALWIPLHHHLPRPALYFRDLVLVVAKLFAWQFCIPLFPVSLSRSYGSSYLSGLLQK